MKIEYPAIIYFLDNIDFLFADDNKYKRTNRYTIQLITKDPESQYVDDILELKYFVTYNFLVELHIVCRFSGGFF